MVFSRSLSILLVQPSFRIPLILYETINEPSQDILCDLQTFLRLIDAVPTGGTAKLVIQGGECMLNGAIETRRAKKLYSGDVVVFNGSEYNVDEYVSLKGYVYKPKRKNR